MNILQVQDDLKNFSQQQLIQEMKQPKGVAPQFLVLGEITRRKRMSDDMKTRGAADQKTVAQEVVSAAGVPQGGLAQMSQAMAPKSSIEPNMQPPSQAQQQAPMTMASGGILSLAAGGKTKREKAFFLEFPKNSPIFAGERRYVTANTLSKLEASMPLFFKRMRSRGEIIANENAPEAFQKTATKLAPAQLNVAMRRGKENIAQAEEAARIAELQAETGATDGQAVTSAGKPTASKVIDEVQSLDAPVAEPSEFDIQQDSDIEGDLLMADDYDRAEKERLRQEALATGLVPSQTTSQIRDVNSGVKPFRGSAFPSLADMKPYPTTNTPVFNATSDEAAVASAEEIRKQEALKRARENARAYAEGRTPKQENQQERDRQKARDSAITALGEIDRSPDPYADDVVIPQDAMDYLNAINADTSDPSKTKTMADDYLRGRGDLQAPSSIGGGAEAQMLAEGRPMTEAEYLFNMQRQQDSIKDAGGFIPPNIGAIELNQPSVQRGLADEAGRIRASNELVKQLQQEAAGMQPFDISNQDPNFAGVLAAQDQQSRFADAAAAAENSRRLMAERGMLKSQRENMARILSGDPQGMDFNANLASPELDESVARGISIQNKKAEAKALEDYANRVTAGRSPQGPEIGELQDYIAEQSRLPSVDRNLLSAEDYDAMAVQKADQESADKARQLQSALSADVDVRDAELGGAFAKGDDGTEQGFFFDDPSTSEIIQRQLDRNKAADERQKRNDDLMITGESSGYGDEDQRLANEQAKFSIVDPYAADRAAIASSDTILNDDVQNDIAYLDNRIEGAKAVLAGGGNIYTPGRTPPFQSYNLQTYEESPSVTIPYYEQPTMRETGEYGPMIGGAQGRTDIMRRGEAERIAFEGRPPNAGEIAKAFLSPNLFGYGGIDADPLMFGSETPNIYPEGTKFFDPRFVEKEREDLISKGVSEVRAEDARSGLMTPNEILGMDSAGMSFVGAPDTTPNDPKSLDMSRLITREDGTNVVADFGQNRQGEANNTKMDNYAFYDGRETGADAEEEFDKDNPFAPVPFKKAETAADIKNETDDATDTALGGSGSKSTKSGTGGSASSQILDLLKSQEANADSDKWLALANAGMALMSSKQPTLGGALGEAGQVGIAGLIKSRRAGDAAKLKTLKFQAGLEAAAAKAGKSGLSASNMVSLINSLSGDNARIATEIAKLEAKSADGISLEPQDDAYLKSLRLMLTSNLVDIQGYRRQAGLAALPKTQDVRTPIS